MKKIDVIKKRDVTEDILSAVALGTGVVLALGDIILDLTINSVPESFKLYSQKNKRRYYYAKSRTLKLVDDGYLRFEDKGGKKVLRLTNIGEEKLRRHQIFDNTSKKQKWDGKWRIVMYDVWETQKGKRNVFRTQLKNFGFKQLQRSVWIYPYECEEFISLLKISKKFGNNVRYIVTEKIDNDYSLKKMFGLHNK